MNEISITLSWLVSNHLTKRKRNGVKKNELDEIRKNSDDKTTNSDEISVKYEVLVDTKIQSTS